MIVAALHPDRLDGITSIREEIADVISGKTPTKVSAREKKRMARVRNPFQAPREILESRAQHIGAGTTFLDASHEFRTKRPEMKIAANRFSWGGGGSHVPPRKEWDLAGYRQKLISNVEDYARDLGLGVNAYLKEAVTRLRWPSPRPAMPSKIQDLDTPMLERVERMAYRDHRKGTG